MMREAPVLVRPLVLFVAMTLLSGCVATHDDDDDDRGTLPPVPGLLGNHTIPMPDAQGAHDWLVEYVTAYPMRITGTPMESMATAHIASSLEDAGYEVQVMQLGAYVPALPGASLKAIVATIPGTTMPDHWLAWGGHYDTVPQTVEGAYDNGSGIALALEMARALADVETERTKAVILFNGEEEGLLASSAFVDMYEAQSDFVIDLFIGFDMVGIAYPAPHPLAFFSGEAYGPEFVPLAREVAIGELGLPDDNESVTFSPRHTRNSDEAVFASAGLATMRFAGMQTAGAYPGYHTPEDTMQTIYDTAGGEDNFVQGLSNTIRFASGMLLALDVSGVPDAAG